MRIICLDDHPTMLDGLIRELNIVSPDAQIHAFQNTQTALEFAEENGCDVLFSEIDLYGDDGLMFAEKMQALNPRLNIIFTTVCEEGERAKEVFRLHPSGYLTKPYTQEQIAQELSHLRYPVETPPPAVYREPVSIPQAPLEPQPSPANTTSNVENRRMDNMNLRKLSRTELLEMLIAQSKEMDLLKAQLQEAREQLENRRLIAEESGSIAQAALQLNGVFEAAQRAADQYLESVRLRTERQVEACARQEKECADRVEQMLADTYERCVRMEERAQKTCDEAKRKAEEESRKYWDTTHEKMENYLTQHEELRSFMNLYKPMPTV